MSGAVSSSGSAELGGEAQHLRPPENQVFGVAITNASLSEIVDLAVAPAGLLGPRVKLLCTLNLDHVVNLGQNPAFRAAYDSAEIVTLDGTPVFIYARLVGLDVKEKVPGADLFGPIFGALSPERHRPFFVVSDGETAARLRAQLRDRGFAAPDGGVCVPPFGFEQDADASAALCREISQQETTHLFFCLGSPKSEIWVHENRHRLPPAFAFCFGSAANFHVGTLRRAPPVLRRVGMEWAWRVLMEPRRLARRYFVSSLSFIDAVIADQRSRRPPR